MNFIKDDISRKLDLILRNFIDVLRINILIVDSKGNPALMPQSSGYGFQGESRWGLFQYLGRPEFISHFQIEGNYLKSVNIFGFQIFAIPILMGHLDEIGYLIVGPVILNKQMEQSRYQALAQQANINSTDFLECLTEVRVLTFNSIKSILDLLSEISRYTLRMNYEGKSLPQTEGVQQPFSSSIFLNLLNLSMSLTQAECGSIMLLNPLTNKLSILIYKGMDLQQVQDIPIDLKDGIAGFAVQNKESFVIEEGHPNNRIRHLLKKPELKCALVVPIVKSNKEVIGVLNISTHQKASRLATHSQEMLKSLTEITSGMFSYIL